MNRRDLYCLLGARSLSYATACFESLFRNVREPISLTLITDSQEDKQLLNSALERLITGDRHTFRVFDKNEADHRAEFFYAEYPLIREFRNGNPCWRKITDPSLFAASGKEMIVIDPDVYFPNPFSFEVTPETGLLLMWQKPNCLFPPETVRRCFKEGIRLADHGDIGICQTRFPMNYEWLDQLIGKLGPRELPKNSMHVESIVWAAMALEFGGGHLNPQHWICWENSIQARVRARLWRLNDVARLRHVDFRKAKCFHAGGIAKHWLVRAKEEGVFETKSGYTGDTQPIRLTEYPRVKFEAKQMVRALAGRLGLLKLLSSSDY